MRLQLCTWCEVEEYLCGSTGVIIPIGSTEQHGPTGLIGTDAICPETVARGIGEALGVMIAPTLSIGMAQHHLAFAGSITLRPTTLIAVIKDVVNSLAGHGFNRFFFLNGHGGNIATIRAAFAEIYAETSLGTAPADRPALRCRLKNWWSTPGVRKLSQDLFGDAEGSHATPSEVSLSYFAYPESVKSARLEPARAPEGDIYDATDYRRQFPDGRIGSDPSLASVDAGERLYRTAVTELGSACQAFFAER